MTYIKRYAGILFFTIFEILVFLFFLSLLYYFDLIQEKTYSILKLIFLLGIIFIQSFFLGKKTIQKGYLEGIKYGLFMILLSFIPSVFLKKFQLKVLLFYGLILLTSILGSMIGINHKQKNSQQ